MLKSQATEILNHLVSDVVFERRESVVMTAAWVAGEALRQLKNSRQRAAALREGAEAIAREVLANSNPVRYRISRFAEFQYVQLEHLTDGELLDLIARIRAESLACAHAAFCLQERLTERRARHDYCPVDDEFGCEQRGLLQ